jgi:hypothetical protein
LIVWGLLLVLAAALWMAKQIVGPLIGQQVKGSVPDYTADRARAAAKLLPSELAEQYEDDWLAELHALVDKPLSAIRYAHGLRRAARRIASQAPGFDRRRLSLPTVESLRRRTSKRTVGEWADLAARILVFTTLLLAGVIVFFAVSLVTHPGGYGQGLMGPLYFLIGGTGTAVLIIVALALASQARLRVRKSKEN